MEIFEQQLELLKVKLKYTLIELGGRATLRQFGYNFRKNYGIVNLQQYGLDKFSQLIQNFSDVFTLSYESKDWWIQQNDKLLQTSTVSSISVPQQPPLVMSSNPNIDKDLFDRYLTDCESFFMENENEDLSSQTSTPLLNHQLKSSSAMPSHSKNDKLPAVINNKMAKIVEGNWSDKSSYKTPPDGMEKKANGLNPFFDTEPEPFNFDDIQPEIFIPSNDSSVENDLNHIEHHASFFDFDILNEELVVGGFPKEGNASDDSNEKASAILKEFNSSPMSNFSSEFFKYKLIKESPPIEAFKTENGEMDLEIKEYFKFEENFKNDMSDNEQQSNNEAMAVNSETSLNENVFDANNLDDEISNKSALEDYICDQEAIEKVIEGFEKLHLEEHLVDDDSLIELEAEIETLDTFRDGKSSGTQSLINLKQTLRESFENMSSFNSTLHDDDDDNNGCEEYDGPRTVNEMLAALPYDAPVFYSKYPPHNRDPTFILPKLDIEESFKNQKIFITEINNPAHFWFQMEENHEMWIKSMQKRLNSTYFALRSKDLKISRQSYQDGLLVAGYHPVFKEWYRARINSVKKQTVHLFFIDYGTHVFIRKKYIKYLLDEFLRFPKACDRGRIHGVMPCDGRQTYLIEEMDLFITKLTDEHFEADLIHYDEEQDVYEMNIKFSKNDQDLAEWVIEDKICEKVSEDQTYTPLLTHEMLETGTHPSFALLLHYQQQEKIVKETA